jgi:hypothetical protein
MDRIQAETVWETVSGGSRYFGPPTGGEKYHRT